MVDNSLKHSEDFHHFNNNAEKRKSCPYTMPTVYLALEAILCLLGLYIVNMGGEIQSWNKLIVSAVFMYFMLSSFRRYLKVIERSKIHCVSDSHDKNHKTKLDKNIDEYDIYVK